MQLKRTGPNMKTLIITPTYNEKENIELMALNLTQFDCDILFIDDNSPDGTGQKIETFVKDNHKVKLLKRQGKMGLGSAYIEGFDFAVKNGYDKIIMMDADLSHPYTKIPELLNAGVPFAVGSRYIAKGSIEGWPWHRYLLSKFANRYASLVLNIGINDLTSGFNCIEKQVLERINYKNLRGEGYAFLIELKYRAFQKGFSLKEVPIKFKEREKGKSKISKKIIYEAFWLVLKLKFFH